MMYVKRYGATVPWLVAAALALCAVAHADDWPTYLHDNARSGVTDEHLKLPLNEVWVFESRHEPRPAWPAPAKQDFWHELRGLRPVVTYDRAFHAVAAGGAVYFGSTADDKVYCLDAVTGDVRWAFYAEGPVRLAPTVADGRAYFTSDDGRAYCLRADDGGPLWTYQPKDVNRRIPGNGRVVSDTPARTGVLVDQGVAHFFIGLFPSQEVYQCALDAVTGKVLRSETIDEVSPQGYLLASPTRLFVPTGRTTPAMFDRETGRILAGFPGGGGAYAVLVDEGLASGPGRQRGNELNLTDPASRESIATFPGIRMVVRGDMAYLESREKLSALNRTQYVARAKERNGHQARLAELNDRLKALADKDGDEAKRLGEEIAGLQQAVSKCTEEMAACYAWEKPIAEPHALILAGDTLFAGGEGVVTALSAGDGAERWRAQVPGRAYGLSVADGALYVSTDAGTIHCFRSETVERERIIKAATDPAPYPEDGLSAAYRAAAARIVEATGVTNGYCIVLGCGEGRLAHELAKRTDLTIVGVEEDAKKVARARDALDRAGLYGVRVAVLHWRGDTLPFTSQMANLIVSDEAMVSGKLSVPAGEVFRLLRPYGGVACIGQGADAGRRLRRDKLEQWLSDGGVESGSIDEEGGVWALIRRGPLQGVGEWTQLYANPSHTACSMDPIRGPMAIQWFGGPGPRQIIDRHHRPMSPLFKDGRVFVPADDLVIAVDAYNGTPLWQFEAPNSRRVGALKNSGHLLVTDDYLYIAVQDACWGVDVAQGERALTIPAPQLGDGPHDWGYLNCVGDALFGTGHRAGASFSRLAKATVNMLEGDHRPVICSEYLFCVDRHTGKKRWTYRKGAILNNGITIDEGRVYLIESRNDEAVDDEDGRVQLKVFFAAGTHLVALDLESGKKLWERPVELPFHHIAYLNGAHGTLLASGSYNDGDEVYYGLFGFDMATGGDKWATAYRALDVRGNEFAPTRGSHGEQWQHPVIIGDTFYSRPFAYRLETGEKLDFIAYRGGHGCGGWTGSAHYLYGRGDNPRMYPIETKKTHGIQLTKVSRPGCWLNILPVGGLILVPESSSGCTCAFPLQTSFAFIPKDALPQGAS